MQEVFMRGPRKCKKYSRKGLENAVFKLRKSHNRLKNKAVSDKKLFNKHGNFDTLASENIHLGKG